MDQHSAESETDSEGDSPEREHLRTLSIFHYLLGALTFLVAGMFVVHLIGGALAMSELSADERARLPVGFGSGFTLYGTIGIVGGWSLAALNAISGWCLARRKFRGVSLVVAALNLAWPPVGTGLGIITLIILARDSVRRQYAAGPARGTR
jgi:hypothetical protein